MPKEIDGLEIDMKKFEESLEEVKGEIDNATEIIYNSIRDEIIQIVFDLLGEGMRRAPVEEGTLRGSGIVKLNDNQVGHTEATGAQAQIIKDFEAGEISLQRMVDELMGEVAFNTPYATVQHERTEFNHPQGGEAKYLEKPLKANAEVYTKELAKAVDKALKKGK